MRTAVIYCSQTGFTRRYAQWIAEEAGADCFPLDQVKSAGMEDYEAIVFGSWACAGTISKLGWFKRRMGTWADKRLILFCTGASPAESPEIGPFLRRNFTDAEWARAAVFYCPGGLNYEGMGLPSRLMMGAFVRAVQGKRGKTPEEEAMARMIGSSYDITDKKYIAPVLACLDR